MPAAKTPTDAWYKHLGNWIQLAIGTITLGGMLATGIIWASDQRYVKHEQLEEALVTVADAIRVNALEAEIADLQDDIVFFSEEGDMQNSVKRRCRKLPRVIQDWESTTDKEWEEDPIVEGACIQATTPPADPEPTP